MSKNTGITTKFTVPNVTKNTKLSRKRGGLTGKVPSLKMHRMLHYQSLLERDFIYLLDFDPAVTSFNEQPFKIYYKWENKKRYYTPDFFVEKNDHQYLVECKPKVFVDNASEEDERKWAIARQWCQSKGYHFEIVTDEDVRKGYRLENIELLTDHARHEVPHAIKAHVFTLLNQRSMKVSDLMTALSPHGPPASIMPILHMAYHHEIYIPIDKDPITTNSMVSLFKPSKHMGQ